MRRIIFICVLLMTVVYSDVAFADSAIETMQAPIEADQAVMNDIQSLKQDKKRALEMWDFKNESEIPIDVGQPYQVFIFHKPTIKGLATNYEVGSLKKALINSTAIGSPFWEYPLVDKTGKATLSAEVEVLNGKASVVGTGPTLSSEMIELSSNGWKLRDKLREQNVTDVTSITHIRDTSPEVDYLYLTTKDADYIMPLEDVGGEPVRQMGFEVGKTYPAKDFVLKIAEQVTGPATENPPIVPQKYGPDGPKDPRLMLAGGGNDYSPIGNQVDTEGNANANTVYYGSAVGIAAILLATILMLIRRRRNTESIT
ncbi:MAG: hypothetical protein HY779_00425 [Rubrobacteridae bacterium]|nr:hypothetical protein [Rubrobacteridae bacterium]